MIKMITATDIQGYKATRLQGYKATRLQGYKATRLQGYKATRLHGYTATRLHGYTATRLHGYTATRLIVKLYNTATSLIGVSNLFETKEVTHFISQINLRYHSKSGSTKIPFFNFRWRLLNGVSNLFETKSIKKFIEISHTAPSAMLNALRSPLYFSFAILKKKIGGRSNTNKLIEIVEGIIIVFIVFFTPPHTLYYFRLKRLFFPKTEFLDFKKTYKVVSADPPFLIPGTCQVSKTW